MFLIPLHSAVFWTGGHRLAVVCHMIFLKAYKPNWQNEDPLKRAVRFARLKQVSKNLKAKIPDLQTKVQASSHGGANREKAAAFSAVAVWFQNFPGTLKICPWG